VLINQQERKTMCAVSAEWHTRAVVPAARCPETIVHSYGENVATSSTCTVC